MFEHGIEGTALEKEVEFFLKVTLQLYQKHLICPRESSSIGMDNV